MKRTACVIAAVCAFWSIAIEANGLDTVRQEAVRDAVAKVAPAVVQIETVGGSDEIGDLPVGTGPTTGLVIDAEGHVVSSSINFAHAPSGILVRFPDGRRQAARLVATDHNRKLSLLKVDVENPPPLPKFADPKQVRVGQWAIAVGRAFDPERPNVAVGIVSALDRVWGKAIQTDAAVSPNNYGGPLIDLHGEVVGLLVPMSPMSDDEVAGVEWYDSGIGFAVPCDALLQAASRLKAGDDLYGGHLGVTFRKSVAMSGPPVVTSVFPNSPAEKAGLKKDDRIVRVGEDNISRSAQIRYELAARYAGDTLEMLVRRGDETLKCQATLVAELEPYRCPLLGILPQREKENDAGVTVRFTVPDTPAAQVGIESGDRIVALGGEPVANAEELRDRIARKKPADKITVHVLRGQEDRNVEVTLAGPATQLTENVPAAPIDPEAAAGREVPLKLPEWRNDVSAYLPKGYSDESSFGLLVWLKCATDDRAGVDRWKQAADNRRVIVVLVEPSSTERWQVDEVELVRGVLQLCTKRFSLDPHRVVLGGQAGGGALAYRAATLERDNLRGCIAFDARLAGAQILDRPDTRFSLLIGRRNEGTLAERLARNVEQLRKGGLPTIVLPREGAADRLSDTDVAAIMRWIDLLDQI